MVARMRTRPSDEQRASRDWHTCCGLEVQEVPMFRVRAITLLVVSLLSSAPALAQQSVVRPSDLRAAMADKAQQDEARRDLVVSVLKNEKVREMADRMSLDLTRAEQAVATLSDDDLEAAASAARDLQDRLSGEADTVTISLTALLLIIIIVILIVD